MSVPVANKSCVIDHSAGSVVSGGTFTITAPESMKAQAPSGAGIRSGPQAFNFTGGSISGGDPNTALGTGTIAPTAQKVLVDGLPVVLEGDTGTLTGTHTVSGTPTPFTSSVEIADAGQTDVKAV